MIYFIQETGLFRNRVKIGFTTNVKNRLVDLQIGSASPLRLIVVLPGDADVETVYHLKFAQYRLRGEWFKFGFWLRFFIWVNRSNTYLLPKPEDIEIDPEEAERLAQEEAERVAYEAEIVGVFEGLANGSERDTLSWRKVTLACFPSDHAYGSHYTGKVKGILDRAGMDYNFLG